MANGTTGSEMMIPGPCHVATFTKAGRTYVFCAESTADECIQRLRWATHKG